MLFINRRGLCPQRRALTPEVLRFSFAPRCDTGSPKGVRDSRECRRLISLGFRVLGDDSYFGKGFFFLILKTFVYL